MESVRLQFGYDYCFTMDAVDRVKGLAVLWKKETLLTVKSFSRNQINIEIMLRGDVWRMTRFYGYSNNSEKALSWSLLQTLKMQLQCP